MAFSPGYLNIYDSQFTSAQTINNFSFATLGEDSPYQILEQNVIWDALFDSSSRFNPPKCHPGTRTALLHHLRSWAKNADSQPVMWVRGGVGAGKSAIAQTLSEEWDRDGLLAASFYLSRTTSGLNEKRYIVSTIAYNITTSIPVSRELMEKAITRTPRIFERNLQTQMQKLIVEPLISLSSSAESESLIARIVVLDGLDECCINLNYPNQNFEEQQREILESIHSALKNDGFPLRFLILSRPERQIREIFEHGPLSSMSSCVVLDDAHNTAMDIEIFLRYELGRAHPSDPPWLSEDIIKRLVLMSSGHFMYAAVMARFLGAPRLDPVAGLGILTNLRHLPDRDHPLAELDSLYERILLSVASHSLPTVLDIFGLMIYGPVGFEESAERMGSIDLFRYDITTMSPTYVAEYLFISLRELYIHLTDLHSVLDVPSSQSACTTPIRFLHTSFEEFLTQPFRSRKFCIDKAQARVRILSNSVRHLFVQILSPGNGPENVYEDTLEGFAYQVSEALRVVAPDDSTLKALRALINQDTKQFTQYVDQNGLAKMGTTRFNMQIVSHLYRQSWGEMPVVLAVLKKHPVPEFVPFDPADFWPYYRDVLESFTGGVPQA